MAEKKTEEPKAAVAKKTDIRSYNIYQKLAEITGKIGVIEKGGENREQHYSFIEYAAVAGKLRTLFAEYGVLIVPRMPKGSEQMRETFKTAKGGTGVSVLIDFTFEIINADNPTDKFDVTWSGEAVDYGDKATNKAATSALKYYMMRQFNVSEKGEIEADAISPERGVAAATTSQPVKAAAAVKVTVTGISDEELGEVRMALMDKGIEVDDIDATIKKLAKVEDVTKISAANAKILLDKIKAAESTALRTFVYGDAGADVSATVHDEGTVSESDDSDTTDDAKSEDKSLNDESEKKESEIVVDDAYKENVRSAFKALVMPAADKSKLLREATSKFSIDKLTEDDQWKNLHAAMVLLDTEGAA